MTAPKPVPTSVIDYDANFTPWDSRSLIYFLVNVGDGDTQLLVLPEREDHSRPLVVVDIATTGKLIDLIEQLKQKQFFPGGHNVELVVATHPHSDHIGGIPEFLNSYLPGHFDQTGGSADFWEPGYFHTSSNFINMMNGVEDLRKKGRLRPSQPTSGYTRYVGDAKFTVLTPGIALRNRYDSYGVDINNSSLSLQVEYPASRVFPGRDRQRQYLRRPRTTKFILGGDTQTLGWSQALVDFPNLEPSLSPAAKAIQKQSGTFPLSANVFKISHHASKNGVNLELVKLISPNISLISSTPGGGKYNFPHDVTLNLIREAIQPVATTGKSHDDDHILGIHHTGVKDDQGNPLGSVAIVVSPGGSREFWRFQDRRKQKIDLAKAAKYTGPGH